MAAQPSNSLHNPETHADEAALQTHFDEWSQDYDSMIHRMFPDYKKVFDTLFLFTDMPNETPDILELGVGTGNLTMRALQAYPKANYTLLDLSEEMLAHAENKLKARNVKGYELVPTGFMEADFGENKFDLVITSLALHHLLDEEKEVLYKRIFQWLKPGGQFRCIDGHYTLPVDKAHPKVWEKVVEECKQTGVTESDFAMWQDHEAKYDHFVPLSQHFSWLSNAGFVQVDCYWKRLLVAVFGGEKPKV